MYSVALSPILREWEKSGPGPTTRGEFPLALQFYMHRCWVIRGASKRIDSCWKKWRYTRDLMHPVELYVCCKPQKWNPVDPHRKPGRYIWAFDLRIGGRGKPGNNHSLSVVHVVIRTRFKSHEGRAYTYVSK